jgi:SRSO17 transposase
MFRITDYPAVVRNYLDRFEDLFSRPQLKHFAEYVTGLIVCDKATIKQINDSFIGHREYSNKDRFIREVSWPEEEVDQRRLELIKESVGPLNPDKGVLVIDDTLLEKTGQHIDEVGTFYDHAEGRYILGHNMVSSHYVTPRSCFPIGWRLYLKRDKQDASFKNKLELAQELIEQAISTGLRFKTVVFDAWYLSKELVKDIESKGLHWVGPAKSNRLIFIAEKKMSLEVFRQSLNRSDFKKIDMNGAPYYCFTKTVRMSKLGKVRLLIVHEQADLSDEPTYLVTDNLRWEARRILRIYQSRWQIETFYRDAKQNLGLDGYEMRDLLGIKRHWYLVFLSYTLLALGSLDRSLRKWVDANTRTIGERCRWSASEIIRNFTLWVLKQSSLNRSADEIFTIIFASRAKIGRRFQTA